MFKNLTPLQVFGIVLIASLTIGLFSVGIDLIVNKYEKAKVKKSNIEYLTYEDISTSVDEHNRLHLLLYKEGKTLILSDTVALGIHAQISNIVYKDYIQKTK